MRKAGGNDIELCIPASRGKPVAITKSQAGTIYPKRGLDDKDHPIPGLYFGRLNSAIGLLLRVACGSSDAQKIPLADLDTIVTKNAVGGRGVEVEIRK